MIVLLQPVAMSASQLHLNTYFVWVFLRMDAYRGRISVT